MDERQLAVTHDERFRAGEHTNDLAHENPPLRPPGVLDQYHPDLPKAAVKPFPGQPEPADPPAHDRPIVLVPRDATDAEIAAADREDTAKEDAAED